MIKETSIDNWILGRTVSLFIFTLGFIVIMGCNPDKYGMSQMGDVMILYTSIDDNSEIITVEVMNKTLHLEIVPDKQTKLTKRIIPFRQGDLHAFEYKELSRMPGVAVFHFVRKPLDADSIEKKDQKFPVPNNSKKFGKLPKAVAFRNADQLYVYWKIPTNWLPTSDGVTVKEFRIENNALHARIKRDALGLSTERIKLSLSNVINLHEKVAIPEHIIPEHIGASRLGDILIFDFPIIVDNLEKR